MSTNNPFKPAVRQEQKARILITGLDGSGKTWTACELAHALGEKIAVIDTEFDRAKLCVDEVGPFDHLTLTRHDPRFYVEMIRAAAANGYDVVIIDSLTHAWKAVLAAVDATTNSRGQQDGRKGWKEQRPEHDELIKSIVQCPIHVIATARSKREIDWEDDKKKTAGLVPIADGEVRFEFDLILDMDRDHTATVSKVRGCSFMDGRRERRPKREFLAEFKKWLDSGAPVVDTAALARDLIETSGDRDAMIAAMQKAGITSADLEDEGKLAKARKIAEKVKADGKKFAITKTTITKLDEDVEESASNLADTGELVATAMSAPGDA